MRPSQDKIKEVFEANLKLKEYGLVKFTWGNVSALDRETGLVLIKPSGVPYETMTADDIVCVTPDGERVYGKLRPSSDLPTHLVDEAMFTCLPHTLAAAEHLDPKESLGERRAAKARAILETAPMHL